MNPATYDLHWESDWDEMVRLGPFHRHLRRIIFGFLAKIEFHSVLDVGCGRGAFLEELKTQFPKVRSSGVDISSAAVEFAKKNCEGSEFSVLDVSKDCLDQKFDLIICSEVLEHIEEDIAALDNIARMASDYLVISTPLGRMRNFEKAVGHVRNYSRDEIQKKIAASGFRTVKVVEWGFPFYSPIYRNVLDLLGGKGTTGEFGPAKRILAQILYYLFFFNSSTKGDEIFILAQRK